MIMMNFLRRFLILFQKFLAKSGWKEAGDVTLSEFIHYVREHEKNLKLQFSHIDKNQDGEYIEYVLLNPTSTVDTSLLGVFIHFLYVTKCIL